MKNLLYKLLFFSFIISGFVSAAQAQECNMLAPGSDAGFDQIGFCGPVTGRVKYFTFYAITEIPTSALKVEINWGVEKKRYDVKSLGYDPHLKMYAYQMPEATYVYEQNRANPKCSYPVTVQAMVNNKVCGSPKQSGTVIVWDKDNANGGSLLFAPTTYYACPGTEFSVNFVDESTWNCVPPQEKTNINWPKRTTQFVYGTVNTISGTVKINDASVSSFPMEGPYQEYKDKEQGPNGDFSRAAKITIPATAKVGERFEITLNNWNYCNQRPEAPIQQKAIIEIVAKPEAAFTIKNQAGEEAQAFCPGVPIQLFGSFYTTAGHIPVEAVRYDWAVEDLKTGTVQKFENQKDLVFEKGFAKPGEQKITLKVSNKNTNGQACEGFLEKTIALIDAPSVTSFINDTKTKELFLCADDLNKVNYRVTFSHSMQSNEGFTYTYNFYKRNSTKTSPDSTLNVKSGKGIKNIENNDNLSVSYIKPGSYRVEIVAKNNSTGCATVEENKVVIYERPIPDFTFSGFCVGQPTKITDKSKVSNSVPGDKLSTWEWDMDYSEENEKQNTFDKDKTGKSAFNWVYKKPGIYRIALKTTSKAGCEAILVKSIEVKDAPIAQLESNYSGGLICPGDTIRFFNKSVALNDAERFPLGINYTLFISDDVATKEIPFSQDKPHIDYSAFYNPNDTVITYTAWLEAKGNDPENCTVSSDPIKIKVRSGAAAGYTTIPLYSPFEPNCTPKIIRFVTNKATQELNADRYKWTIVLNGEIKDEVIKERGKTPAFDTLDYTFGNKINKHLDYDVVLSVEKAGICVAPSVNTYRIYPNPKPFFTATPILQVCDSAVFELKVADPAGISDYAWTFSALPSNDKQTGVKDDNFYITYIRPAFGEEPVEYTIKLSAKNFYGCEGEWTEKIVVNPVVMGEPKLALKNLEGNGCSPYKATLLNQTIGDATKSTYALYIEKVGTGAKVKVEDKAIEGDLKREFSYVFNESGDFKVYLEGKALLADGECTRPLSAPIIIHVKEDPNPNFTVFPTEDCGSLTAVIAKTSLESEFNTWIIKDNLSGEILYNSGKVLAAADPFHTYVFENTTNVTKQYTIQHLAENAAGCAASDSMVVTVFPKPKAHFTVATDACEPYVVSVNHQTEDNPASVSYIWLWGDGTTSEGANPPAHNYYNTSYTSELHYNLKLIAKTKEGCSTDSTIRVIVHPRVKADFDVSTMNGCAPLNVRFMDKSKGAVEAESGWFIKEEGQNSFAFVDHTLLQYTFENNTTAAKNYEIMYIAKNAGGCADSVTKEITVQPAVVADFSASPENAYSNEKITFTNNKVIPGVKYTWNWGDKSAVVITDKPTISHAYTNTSIYNHYYEVTLTAEDPVYGCKSTKKVVVTVYPELQLTLSPKKDTVCVPEIPEFITNTKNVSSHYWYVGKKGQLDFTNPLENIYDPALFDNTTNNPISYEVIYVGVTAEGNKDSVQTEVMVYPSLKPSFSLDGFNKELPKAVFAITNTTPLASAWETTWDFGNGETSNKVNPGTYTYTTYGNFTITMTISNGFCSQSFSQNVTVADAKPDVSFEMENMEGCWPLTVTFKNTSKFTDNGQYKWDFGDGMGTSTAIHPSYTYTKPGNYKVTLQATNRTGKENGSITSPQVIKVYPKPTPDFVVRNEKVALPDEPVYVANYSDRGVWFKWDFGDGTIYEGADQFEPVHYYKKPGTYDIKLTVRSEYGCEDSVIILRAVTADGSGSVIVPNAFTPGTSGPNGGHIDQGGVNDVFHPVFKGKVERYQLLIYNRWGELMFETKDTTIGWDGYYKGKLSISGVYLYKLSATMRDGQVINKVGDLTLIQ